MRTSLLLTLLLMALSAFGVDVMLAWDPSPGTNIASYTIYVGEASGMYSQRVNAGNVTNFTVTGLSEGVTHYFVATATDTSGLESDFSNEVSWNSAGNHDDYGLPEILLYLPNE